MEILITLCARGGSKGIPGKNIRQLAEKPLLAYSIGAAKEFAKYHQCKIALSTDDMAIREVASQFGVFTDYIRPTPLATDDAGKIDTIRDLLFYEENISNKRFDYLLDLDITSPLRTTVDLLNAFKIISEDENCYNLFSVNKAQKNPYFNMVEQKENGYFGLVKKGNFLTRQSAIPVFDMNASFYFYRRSFFDNLTLGVVNEHSLIYCMNHICFDLDHPLDFEFLSFLIEHHKIDFLF
jgi:CMP-N,N'-diacetyllegionaminic acid synthase